MWSQQQADGRVVHPFERAMLVLALLIIPVVLVEESQAPHGVKLAASIVNWAIWIGFTAELVGVLVVAPRKRAALRAHWLEAAIVILTPPFLSGALGALRAARLIRLLRLARLGVLGTKAVRAERLFTSREGFRYVAMLTALLIALAGATISLLDAGEFPNVGLGMWWAITTVTTVGYGDVVPHTVAGRIVAACLMLVGIGFISIFTATIASGFIERDSRGERVTLNQVMEKLTEIERRLESIDARRA
jgi:voltage-gated potassium channel